MVKIVVLVLTTVNTWTGETLYVRHMDWDRFAVTGNQIEDCRRYGVQEAHRLTEKFKAKGYSSSSTNVDCHWEMRLGDPA